MVAACGQEELFALWSAARAEANLAYDAWCVSPGAGAYAVYRAAEDRADAAESSLWRADAPAPALGQRAGPNGNQSARRCVHKVWSPP